jgi:transcriptional regulator with XRE-family HTH domain
LTDTIQQAIRESGISLNELSKQTGVSTPQLSRFMRGERSLTLSYADKLVSFFGIEVKLPTQPKRGQPPRKGK